MVVVVAGIKRTGSTVQYNLVRLALEMSGHDVRANPPRSQLGADGYTDVVKIHPFRKVVARKADHVFLTHRDPEEIMASLDRFSGGGNWDRFHRFYRDFFQWALRSDPDHYCEYEEWEEDPIIWTERVVGALGVDVEARDVLNAFNEIEPPESGQDPVTLLFHNHITSK